MQVLRNLKNIVSVFSLIFLDIVAFYSSLTLAFYTRKFIEVLFPDIKTLIFSLPYFLSFCWIPLIFIAFITYERLYIKRLSFWDETKELIKAITIAIVITLAIVTLGKMTDKISRLTILFLWMYSLFLFPLFKLFGKKMLCKVGLWRENVIIIGAGSAGRETVKGLNREIHFGYNIIGFLDDADEKIGKSIQVDNREYKVFGKTKYFKKFVNLLNVSTVIIAIPSLSLKEISGITSTVQQYTKRVLLVPDLKGIALLNTELHHLFMQQLFLLKINNNLKSPFNRLIKRSSDLILSALSLPFLLPLIAVIGALIKLDSHGPVFLIQDRIGKNKRIFKCIKFRTMHVNSDEIFKSYLKGNDEALEQWNKYKKLRDYDPRLTKIGKFLRRTSLDELPQIFNVLKGDMSLFGPRPYLPDEEGEMNNYIDLILLTSPGITGLWQVSGRNALAFNDRLKLDAWYVLNWSLWLDIVILFKTIRVVLSREGAY